MLMLYNTIAQNIRAARTRCNYTQEKVAEMLCILTAQYSRIECERVPISLNIIDKLSEMFCAPVSLILENAFDSPKNISSERENINSQIHILSQMHHLKVLD